MADRPNVIVIMSDQQKATSSHLWGNSFCETPNLARLARQGVLFEHAYTPHPLCMPARVSFWTGRYPHSHGSRRNETPMRPGTRHGVRLWKEAGYHVGLIGKNHCFTDPADIVLFDTWCEIGHGGIPDSAHHKGMPWYRPRAGIEAAHAERRALTPQNPRFGYAVTDHPLEDYSTGLITGQTVRFLEQHRDEPFALWISYPDPHEPWVAPAHYAARFPPEKVALPPRRADEFAEGQAPERNRILYRMLGYDEDRVEDVLALMSVYYGMVKFLDDGVGQILDALERLGLREETILVYCSDHGDFMGEHGMQCKGGAFYDCLTRVPLIVSWPGQTPQNWREASMVSLVDVIPTVLELQGMEAPTEMQGQHLPGVCAGAARREAAFAEYGAGGPPFTMADLDRLPRPHGRQTLLASLHWREAEGRRKMVRTHDWKYVHDPMGDLDELYDLNADPGELHNLAGDRGHEAVVSAMRCRLADWMIQTEDATPVPLPAPRIQSR